MLCTGLHVLEFKMAPTKRRSFCKELKLKVTNNWYFENGENINQAANNFQIDRKQVRNWLNDEEKIRSLKRSRKACLPMKSKNFQPLKRNFTLSFLICERKRVKHWWLNSKVGELVKEKYPDEALSFKISHRWFEGFCRRSRISLRRKAHAAQKSPAALRTAIEKFHAKSLREHKRETFTLKDLGNMEQTLLLLS